MNNVVRLERKAEAIIAIEETTGSTVKAMFEINLEEAHDLAADLLHPIEFAVEGLKVYYGLHPRHGSIYISIATDRGVAVVLPVLFRVT